MCISTGLFTSIIPLVSNNVYSNRIHTYLTVTSVVMFSTGFFFSLLQALFATETFAFGLNMPARTVVFTNTQKFDGKEFHTVSCTVVMILLQGIIFLYFICNKLLKARGVVVADNY